MGDIRLSTIFKPCWFSVQSRVFRIFFLLFTLLGGPLLADPSEALQALSAPSSEPSEAGVERLAEETEYAANSGSQSNRGRRANARQAASYLDPHTRSSEPRFKFKSISEPTDWHALLVFRDLRRCNGIGRSLLI